MNRKTQKKNWAKYENSWIEYDFSVEIGETQWNPGTYPEQSFQFDQ